MAHSGLAGMALSSGLLLAAGPNAPLQASRSDILLPSMRLVLSTSAAKPLHTPTCFTFESVSVEVNEAGCTATIVCQIIRFGVE